MRASFPLRLALTTSTVLGAIGCEALLGIDAEYIEIRETTGTGGADSGAGGSTAGGSSSGGASSGGTSGGAGGAGGISGGGGTSSGGAATGGAPTGGTSGGGSGGASGGGGAGGAPPPDSGCPGCTPDCMPGTYEGTFNGAHAPAVTFVGVPFDVSGPFTFTLAGTGRVLNVTSSSGFQSKLAWGDWSVTLSGQFDCDTQQLHGVLTGKINAPPAFADLHGTLVGPIDGGTWDEIEAIGPGKAGTCKPGTLPPNGTGCGTWALTQRP